MDITNTYRLYAECVSNGAITEPNGGSWISAICIWQGSTEPLNASWLQRHCDNLGITAPLNGSWLIALANHYGETQPINGSWANAVLIGCGAGPVPPEDLIWNEVDTLWENETTQWATATAPTVFVDNQSFTDDDTPNIVGTATPNKEVTITIDGNDYTGNADVNGDWSIEVTNPLSGVASPGTDYPITAICNDRQTGLKSPVSNATITIILNSVVITVQMVDAYGDGWNNGAIAIEKEVTPGVWELQEYDGNPYRYNNASEFSGDDPVNRVYYKDGASGIYGILFEAYEYGVSTGGLPPYPTGDQVWLDSLNIRTITLDPGFNYRTIAYITGDYASERSYSILNGATELAYQPRTNDADWAPNTVQQTFTL